MTAIYNCNLRFGVQVSLHTGTIQHYQFYQFDIVQAYVVVNILYHKVNWMLENGIYIHISKYFITSPFDKSVETVNCTIKISSIYSL